MDSIYLDHNATSPIRPEVADVVDQAYRRFFANPASQHRPGQDARRALDDARERLAALLGANLSGPHPDQVIFTSGGTEANNLAVLGISAGRHAGPDHLVISAIEHASVVEPAEALLERGWQLDCLGVTPDGVVRGDELPRLLREFTRLVSVMLANHETGAVQPVAELAALCNQQGIPLHTDAAQAAGKVPLDFRGLGVAAMSVAAHKFQGPLGVGALILRHDTPLVPLFFGGSQEGGRRPGTVCVALVLGMVKALEICQIEQTAHTTRLTALRQRFEAGLAAELPGLVVNGAAAPRVANTSSIAFPGLDAQILLLALDVSGVACSVGSACNSGSTELSPTLRAMGVPHEVLVSSLRFSLGNTTTEAEIDEAIARILHVCHRLRP